MFVTETTDDKFMKTTVIILVMEAITIVFTPLSIVGGKNGCSSRNKGVLSSSGCIKWFPSLYTHPALKKNEFIDVDDG